MSDETPQELSPKEQHEQDLARVAAQVGMTDAAETVSSMLDDAFGIGGAGFFGRTNFEGHQLNTMLDLIENSNPDDLESAGEALWKARDALKKAGRELEDDVEKVDWKGESGDEFRRFGTALARHAEELSDFADAAGTQITVAGTGLASVRNSKPPRDERAVQKRVEDFPPSERTADNPEYQQAVTVEKDRQEAINQMNRLASFYAVSEETLAAQEPPKFPKTLEADVPPPRPGSRDGEPPTTGPDAGSVNAQQVARERAEGSRRDGGPRVETGTLTSIPDGNTSMEIDSVAAPLAPATGPSATSAPPATGVAGPALGQVAPVASGFVSPVQRGVPRPTSASGAPKVGGSSASAVGRPGAAGSGSPAAGRASAVGRAGAVGSSPTAGTGRPGVVGRPGAIGSGATATGRAGVVGAAGQASVAGRPGAAGYSVAGRAGTGASVGPRAGRTDGIVGGTPQRAITGSTGSRIPRGTVIGGEAPAPGRSSGARPSQSGIIGTSPADEGPRSTRRGTPSSNGVVGNPSEGAPGSRPGAGSFTAGGAGLVGGRPDERESADEERDHAGSAHPEPMTDDEETRAAHERDAVPPGID